MIKKITAAILSSCLLVSCADSKNFDGASDEFSVVRPLPEGVELEKAGSKEPQSVLTTNLLGSLRPDERTPKERVPEIYRRGRLIVGVDQSQNLLSFRDPASGEIEGLEVDIAHEIARDIFGDPNKIEFRFINSANWIDALESKQIDIALRAISVTRGRQDQVFFSTPYLTANTRMLVERDGEVSSLEDLKDKTACVSSASTGLQRLREMAPDTDILIANSAADCLIMLQQYDADAVISDDTILSGMATQDPMTEVVGESLGKESYGIAMAKPGQRHNTSGLIRQVNSTLERIFRDGKWNSMYSKWFSEFLPYQQPPATNYRAEDSDDER